MNLEDLKRELPYKTRPGPSGTILNYIDARQAQDLLDEVCGPENWKVEYKEIHGGLFAGVSIRFPALTNPVFNGTSVNTETEVTYEWITKWDGGTESNIEKEKGLISDSFKRACVSWGIGRFLYSLGTKKAPAEPTTDLGKCEKCGAANRKSQAGKAYCSALCWKN